jgi:ATP-binding cassette subfamily B protein
MEITTTTSIDDKKKKFFLDGAQRRTFSRLVDLCKPERARIGIGILALLTNGVTNLSFPWILGEAVDRAGDADYLYFIGGAGCVYLVGSVASWVRVYCLGTSTERISARLKKLLFNAYMDKQAEFYDEARAAELAMVLDKDVALTAEALTDKLAFGVRSLNSSINGSMLLIYSNPQLCGISLAMAPVVGLGVALLGGTARRFRERLRVLESAVASFALERIQRIATVHLNAQEEHEKSAYAKSIEECYDLSCRHYFVQGSYMSFTNLMTNASMMGILWYGGRLMAAGKMTAGSLTRFAIQTGFVGLGWYGLAQFYGDLRTSLDAAQRVFQIIDYRSPLSISSGKSAEGGVTSSTHSSEIDAAKNMSPSASSIMTLRGVTFSYPRRQDVTVLRGITVSVPEHGLIGFVGKSGTGKSTLLSLMCGLYAPSGGSLEVCGRDVCSMTAAERRKYLQGLLAVVQQNSGLLSGTIAENIAYGIGAGVDVEGKDAAATQALIELAASHAHADNFINDKVAFPDGYQTQIGEGGSRLSGGQQARVAIARALIKKPRVLLLDEATSTLDSDSEAEIVSLLKKLASDHKMTVVVFTHSEQLMRACDCLHLLSKGTVQHSGCYEELHSKGLLSDQMQNL